MKKLGVCVRYITDNYGSMLQLLALQEAIEKIEWDYEFVVYDKKTLGFMVKNAKRIFNIYFFQGKMLQIKKKAKMKRYPQIMADNQKRLAVFEDFRERNFKYFSDTFKGYSLLCKGATQYDAVLVGSDQLWGPEGLDTNFYNLMFVPDNIRKIAYSTSFGVKEIPSNLHKKYKYFIDRIEYISVREEAGSQIVKNITGKDVPVVVDPVMLLSKEEWELIIPIEDPKIGISEPYMLCYLLGANSEHRKAAMEISKKTGWKIVTLPHIDEVVEADMEFGDVQLFDVTPEQFLNLIRCAEYICTDSFHGTAFSIINQKQFTVFNRFDEKEKFSRNSRIDTICSIFNLESCRYKGDIWKSYENTIDYVDVGEKLQRHKTKSWAYLEDALH
ncbi:MAG: polysaccharide pyruvyl transferase family protein [Sedimentibacter sp.]